jgi:hypothetical protein
MTLIENWKHAWKWLSVQIPAVNIAFLGTWSALPTKFQDAIPLPYVIGTAVSLIVIGVVGRLIDQTPKVDK